MIFVDMSGLSGDMFSGLLCLLVAVLCFGAAFLIALIQLLRELVVPGTLQWQSGAVVWGLGLAVAILLPAHPFSIWLVAMLVLPAFAGAAMTTAVRQPASFEIWQFSLKTCFLILTVVGISCGFTRLRYESWGDVWPAVLFVSMSIAGYICGRIVLDLRYINSTADTAWWNAMQNMLPELKWSRDDAPCSNAGAQLVDQAALTTPAEFGAPDS